MIPSTHPMIRNHAVKVGGRLWHEPLRGAFWSGPGLPGAESGRGSAGCVCLPFPVALSAGKGPPGAAQGGVAGGVRKGDGDLLEEVCCGHCRGLSSDARRLRPQRLPMSRAIRGALWRSALWMAGCRHLPQLREVWRVHVVHVPLLLTQHATVDEGRWARLRAAWRGE
jgi:hypothetical protein